MSVSNPPRATELVRLALFMGYDTSRTDRFNRFAQKCCISAKTLRECLDHCGLTDEFMHGLARAPIDRMPAEAAVAGCLKFAESDRQREILHQLIAEITLDEP